MNQRATIDWQSRHNERHFTLEAGLAPRKNWSWRRFGYAVLTAAFIVAAMALILS